MLDAALGRERPELDRGVGGIAHPHRLRGGHELGYEAVVHFARDVDALDRAARLARARAARPDRAGGCPLQVRVREHQHRVLAPELDRHLLLARHAGSGDDAPDCGRSREQDLVDRRLRERHADVRPAVREAHEALRQACAREHARHLLGRERGARGRLEGHSVPRQQRGGDLAQRLRERRAARADHPDDAVRLIREPRALGQRGRATAAQGAAAEHVDAVARDPDQRVDRRQQLERRDLRDRPALLSREHVREHVEVVDHRLRHAPHVASAVLQQQQRPQRLDLRHRLDRVGDAFRRRRRHAPEHLAGRRVASDDRGLRLRRLSCRGHRGWPDYPVSRPRWPIFDRRTSARRRASARSASSGS